MSKEYFVELAGVRRLLRYTRQERVEIENRFDCDIKEFVYKKAFPLDENGKPTLGGRLECQEALIWYGIRHHGPKVTEEAVSRWLQELVTKGGPNSSIYGPLSQAIVGLLASGILGWTPQLSSDEEEDEGKAKATDEEEQAPVALIRKTG